MRKREFQFLTINTPSLWKESEYSKEELDITEEGLSLHKESVHAFGKNIKAPLLNPTDFVVDFCGVLHILDADKYNVLIYDVNTEFFEWLDCFGGYGSDVGEFCNPKSIAISSSNLYIADTCNHRIQTFAKINLQVRWIYSLEDKMEPRFLVLDEQENLYVLTLVLKQLEFSIELTANSEFQTDLDNQNISEELQQKFEDNGISLSKNTTVSIDEKSRKWLINDKDNIKTYAIRKEEDKLNIYSVNFLIYQLDKSGQLLHTFENFSNPIHLAIKDDLLYVLEADKKQVLKFNIQSKELEQTLDLIGLEDRITISGLAVDAAGNIYVGDQRRLSEKAEEDRFLYKFNSSGKLIEVITEFLGLCKHLQIDTDGNIYVLNGETGEITFLESVERFSREGYYISNEFDSGIPGLKWHKIVLETEIPEKTQITASYYISDEEELPSKPTWSQILIDAKDALILNSEGRYLWLKFTLFGDEQTTPQIKSIRAYFPRISYLRYLPGIYQEDKASRDFLERFLSLFETFFFNLEEEIFSVTKYFDVNATPFEEGTPERDFLSWLASWLAVIFDENWTEEQKREFLTLVPELYKKRGTREGLKEFIKIYTEKEPIIFEYFQLDCIKDNEEMKEIWTTLFGDCLCCFCVLLNPFEVKYESDDVNKKVSQVFGNLIKARNQINTVRRIVKAERPAHTSSGVTILQPWIYLNMHSYLGINSFLSQPVFRLGQTSVLSRDTALEDTEAGGQVERHSRMGVDTILT